MDRFVTRTPSWKTLHYNTVVAQSVNKSRVVTKPRASQTFELPSGQNVSNRSPQPLRLALVSSVESFVAESCSGDSNDSGLNSGSSISPPIATADNERPLLLANSSPVKKCRTPTKKHLGKLGDYVDCPEEKENDTCMIIGQTANYSGQVLQPKGQGDNNTFSKELPQTPNPYKQLCSSVSTNLTTEKLQTPIKTPMFFTRIQRDLNSPSASVRVRALKAISSPTNSPYTHFDIPEDEQSLRFSTSQEPCDIKDVMRNVVVYVEVRSGEDDRSEGVRKFIETLGARVNLTFTKDTTHVVFKEGRLSTFKKAHLWRIPVVSILWIEACKTQNRICNPRDYPISNLDRYENPELYSKIKTFKHMQPGSECNKRKVKIPTTKDAPPAQKTVILKKNSTLISTTPTSSSSNHKKTDISQFFKKLDKTNKVITTSKIAANAPNATIESPASQLLSRIASDCYTSSQQSKAANKKSETKGKSTKNKDLQHDEESREPISDLNRANKVKKALDFFQSQEENGTHSDLPATPVKISRRRSVVATPVIAPDSSKDSIEDAITPKTSIIRKRRSTMPPEDTNSTVEAVLPAKNTRRRRSVYTPRNMTIEASKHDRQFEDIEEISTLNANIDKSKKHMELAEDLEVTGILRNEIKASTALSRFGRRRTIYSYKAMNESGKNEAIKTLDFTKQRPTCYSLKSMETDTFDSVNTGFGDCIKANENIEIISEEYASLNNKQSSELKTTKKPVVSASTTRRRTLYTPKKSDANKMANASTAVANFNLSNDLSLSPNASNMQGKVAACSTLLESADKPKRPVEIPPATVTSGKLLEETNECATPYAFRSSRPPNNKRRTVFDVSMDIIQQRLQCINQSARRSLVPSSADNLNNDTKIKTLNTPTGAGKKQKTIILPEPDSENSTPRNNDIALVRVSASAIQKNKRKLFVPNETLTPPLLATNRRDSLSSSAVKTVNISSAKTAEEKNVTKRRRTLMPFSQPSFSGATSSISEAGLKKQAASSLSSSLKNRRSSLDFEETEKTQHKLCLPEEKPLTAEEEVSKTDIKSKKLNVIVYTNMHKVQTDVIREAVSKLGDCELEDTVTYRTTHLVSLEARRTLNLLRALARGLWIVEYNWILDSMTAGELMPEEPYELQGFSRAIKICRSERQAFGKNYNCDLFCDLGPFYVFLRCKPVSRNDLIDLIRLCGGRLSQYRNKARYIIGDPIVALDDKIYLTSYWVLDCITQMKILKVDKYLYPNSFAKPKTAMPSQKPSASSHS